jgi:hypothetical protein
MISEKQKHDLGIWDTIDEHFDFIKSNPADQKGKNSIQWVAHYMDILYEYAKECETIVEFGINEVNSTWAFLKANPKKLTSVDLVLATKHRTRLYPNNPELHNPWLEQAKVLAKLNNIEYEFIESDTRVLEIENSDLLFIDTEHTYEVLRAELFKHGSKINKYIILHDVVLFKQMLPAVTEFIKNNPNWSIFETFESTPGLMILKNKNE